MRRLVVALALVLSLAACGSASDTDATADVEAIDFTAETVGGGQIDMADYAGEPLALWFWSPW